MPLEDEVTEDKNRNILQNAWEANSGFFVVPNVNNERNFELTVSQTLNALKKKSFSATELTKAYLKAIDDIKELNNYIFLSEEKSLSMAKASDEKYMKSEQRNLEGIPIGVKDLFCTDGIETTACSIY